MAASAFRAGLGCHRNDSVWATAFGMCCDLCTIDSGLHSCGKVTLCRRLQLQNWQRVSVSFNNDRPRISLHADLIVLQHLLALGSANLPNMNMDSGHIHVPCLIELYCRVLGGGLTAGSRIFPFYFILTTNFGGGDR